MDVVAVIAMPDGDGAGARCLFVRPFGARYPQEEVRRVRADPTRALGDAGAGDDIRVVVLAQQQLQVVYAASFGASDSSVAMVVGACESLGPDAVSAPLLAEYAAILLRALERVVPPPAGVPWWRTLQAQFDLVALTVDEMFSEGGTLLSDEPERAAAPVAVARRAGTLMPNTNAGDAVTAATRTLQGMYEDTMYTLRRQARRE